MPVGLAYYEVNLPIVIQHKRKKLNSAHNVVVFINYEVNFEYRQLLCSFYASVFTHTEGI